MINFKKLLSIKSTLAAVLGSLICLFPAHANDSLKVIPDSYIVTFLPDKKDAPSLIRPARVLANAEAKAKNNGANVLFDEHSSGQNKGELARTLNISGKVNKIFDTINAAHLLMTADEAERLKKHPKVLSVTQDINLQLAASQSTPGWALDRLDQPNTSLNYLYNYNASGSGQTIYVLDTGLNLAVPAVAAEFGGRASVFWDVNSRGNGSDCQGHGTRVASAAAGATYGTAKGANIVVAKITDGCTGNSQLSTSILAFNWLASNAPRGTIVNWSQAFEFRNAQGVRYCDTFINQELENAIRAAYNNGIIVVVAAGNDSCNTANYTPSRIPEAFVVGATNQTRFAYQQDARSTFSRYGPNISGFAPGENVNLLGVNGGRVYDSGTSFAAPYIAGIFAAGCQTAAPMCSTMENAGVAYSALRNTVSTGTVVNSDGSTLPAGTPSRLMHRAPW